MKLFAPRTPARREPDRAAGRAPRGAWALALPLLLPLAGAATDTPPSPRSVLGFAPGEDRRLADWSQTLDYLQRLDAASPRVRLDTIGSTTEGRPFLLLTISSEANLRRLEEIRRDHQRLADPRGLSEAEAAALLARGRMVVALNHGIHSTEVAGTQTALETAWQLASTQQADLLQVLDQTVVLLIPSQNPDGTQLVAEWYRRTLGTPYEGSGCESACRLPFLYHRYVGHDNNRDWYAFTQQETRLVVDHVYRRWHPVVVHDLHQMGPRSVRIFVPPYLEPWEPNVDGTLRASSNAFGMHMAAALTGAGRRGVAVQALFDAWTPARAYPFTHGGVRLLSETASSRLASPIEVGAHQLEPGAGVDPRVASWNHPLPWPGGTWRLRDAMDYQQEATRALLLLAAGQRQQWLASFLEVNRRAVRRTQPHAFVVPAHQRDALAVARLLQTLATGEVELQRALSPFVADGRRYEAGSVVIAMAQPAGAFAKTVLERQRYPDLRLPGGLPRRPYDATAHSLPLLMGVEVATLTAPFAAALARLPAARPAGGRIAGGGGRWLALPHTTGGLIAVSRLLRERVPARWTLSAFAQGRRTWPAGTLLVPSAARARVAALAAELGLDVRPLRTAPASLSLRMPRVGLYQSWVPSMDEGWTRFVFEKQVEMPYRTLHDAEIRAGGLRPAFDAIVLPDQSPAQMLAGNPAGSLPPEYTGGLGVEGVAALRAFVEQGGTLVALDGAARFAIQELALPVRDALWNWTRPGQRAQPEAPPEQGASEFYCPGSLLEVERDGEAPLTHGLDSAAVWFESSPALALEPEAEGPARLLLRYPRHDPLLAGWLIGPEKLHGLGALAEVPLLRGRVVLFGFRPQYRAQSWGTYVLLLNALYTAAAAAPEPAPGN